MNIDVHAVNFIHDFRDEHGRDLDLSDPSDLDYACIALEVDEDPEVRAILPDVWLDAIRRNLVS